MDHATTLAKHSTGAAEPRLSPLEAFVAWVANFLRTITGMKRRKTFPKNWKDHWEGLSELEWYRDQILAFAAKHVLAGGSLNDRTDFQLTLDVPDDYGICPCTAQAMNRRFIAMAQFRLNPDRYIHRHIRRIARAAGITLTTDTSGCPLRHASHATSPSLRLEEESNRTRCKHRPLSSSNAQHDGLSRRSAAKAEGGSRGLLAWSRARAPPTHANMFENSAPVPQTRRA